MSIFASAILAILGFVAVAYPFMQRRETTVASSDGEEYNELHFKRDTTYSMLKELEFDLRAGSLSEEDYRELEKHYKNKAISILKKIDKLQADEKQPEDMIEAEVRRLRKSGSFCPQCGHRRPSNAHFCPNCGNHL